MLKKNEEVNIIIIIIITTITTLWAGIAQLV